MADGLTKTTDRFKGMVEAELSLRDSLPSLVEELRLWRAGFVCVAGLDEAGRGALAGPVVAGAVILHSGSKQEGVWATVRDSKELSPLRREKLAEQIRMEAAAWSLGEASSQEIDAVGIAAATRLAMRRAVDALTPPPDHLLIDWVQLKAIGLPQTSFTKGDRRIVSIAAASILAKVYRDGLLCQLHDEFPAYRFDRHKGYGTQFHRAAISRYGPCPAHRRTFAPMRQLAGLFG